MNAAVQGGAALIALPQRLDSSAADDLKSLLLEGRSGEEGTQPSLLDASEVDYVGGLCLQLLLASGLALGPSSQKAQEAFALFGVDQHFERQQGQGAQEAGDEKEAGHG